MVDDPKVTATAYLTAEEHRLLKRLSTLERRSVSATIATLILDAAARRGMLAQAPRAVPQANTGP